MCSCSSLISTNWTEEIRPVKISMSKWVESQSTYTYVVWSCFPARETFQESVLWQAVSNSQNELLKLWFGLILFNMTSHQFGLRFRLKYIRALTVSVWDTDLCDTSSHRGEPQKCSSSARKINLWKSKAMAPGLAFSLAHIVYCDRTQVLGKFGVLFSPSCCPGAPPSCVATAITNN